MAAPVTLADTYTIIIHQHNNFDPTTKWRNTHEVAYPIGQTPDPADAIFTALEQFHAYNLTDNCTIDEIECRPWSRGDLPFSQQGALWRKAVAHVGQKGDLGGYDAHGNEEMGGEVCALVARHAAGTGRTGHLFLRGLLEDLDVVAFAGGKWVYKPASNVTPIKFADIANNELSAYLGAAVLPGLVIVRYSAKPLAGPPFIAHLLSYSLEPTVSINKQTRKR